MGTRGKFPSRQANPRDSSNHNLLGTGWKEMQSLFIFGGVLRSMEYSAWLFQASRRPVVLRQFALLAALACLAYQPARAQQGTPTPTGGRTTHDLLTNNPTPETGSGFPALSLKQKQGIVHANFEKSKNDAAELAVLAKELCKDLEKSDVNVLAPEVVGRAERIEKLAKRIRDETKGF
jgi:hypothetical protein